MGIVNPIKHFESAKLPKWQNYKIGQNKSVQLWFKDTLGICIFNET